MTLRDTLNLTRPSSAALELWGGVECTLNRVGNRYFDQLGRSGHTGRLADLDRFASLGVTALRHPILWERIAPGRIEAANWDWTDRSMERLRELGIRPIIGLVHHGSGPAHTNLLSESFIDGLREFAGAVARRYPWAEDYTPINEPLTTARFSCLYGFWFPHLRDLRAFSRALVVQCRATAAAMAEIRAVTPHARLVQTEDFGRTFATEPLRYQARYENRRRLLGLDLIFGLVGEAHPLRQELHACDISPDEIEQCVVEPGPEMIGVDYYLTSDRLLDHRVSRYPECHRGGNGRDAYAYVEAVRAWGGGLVGQEKLLTSLWRRYRRPLAITEAHAGATREEQLRWLAAAWRGAQAARARGCDVRAVTTWSLLGSFDWNTHVCVENNSYESGAYDIRSDVPRPTALAQMARGLARSGY